MYSIAKAAQNQLTKCVAQGKSITFPSNNPGKSRYEPVHLWARVVMNHYKVDMSHHEVDMSRPEVDMSHHKVIMSQSHCEPLHWLVVIISNLPFSLTRSRGEYLRVVGILEMVE